MTAEELAKYFHERYEALAPDFGYTTREASAKPWRDVPEPNRNLMFAVCEDVLKRLDTNPWRYPSRGELPEPNGVVLATWENGDGQDVVYASNVRQNPQVYRAWKRLGTDAPKLEEEK